MNRHAGRVAAVAVVLLTQGHLHSQGPEKPPTTAPMLPLKQVAYIKASNAEAYRPLRVRRWEPGTHGKLNRAER